MVAISLNVRLAVLTLVAGWMALIAYLSSQSQPLGVEDTGPGSLLSYLGHVGEFGMLAVLLRWTVGGPWLRASAIAWGLTFAFGIADEIHQRYTPGRDSSVLDLGVDAAAGAAALAGLRLLELFLHTRMGGRRPESSTTTALPLHRKNETPR